MYCSKCGSLITNSEDKFCKNCGNLLNNEPIVTESVNNYNNPNNASIGMDNEEELVKIFVGKNYEKLKHSKFNFPVFFFGIIYTLYRKMWILSLIIYGISFFGTLIVPKATVFINLAVQIFLAIKWKDIYMKHCKERVEELKLENPTLPREQFVALLTKKGGTTIIPVIIISVFYVLLILMIGIISFIVVGGLIEGINGITNGSSNFPFGFTQSMIINFLKF